MSGKRSIFEEVSSPDAVAQPQAGVIDASVSKDAISVFKYSLWFE